MDHAVPVWLLILLLVLCLGVPVGGAQQDSSWSDEPRRIEFRSDEDGFRFVSVRPRAQDAERLAGSFDLASAGFRWSFQANGSSPTDESSFVFAALVEWRDIDADGSFGVGDTVVRRQSVADLANATLEVVPRPPGGRIVHASYPFPGAEPGPLDPITGRRILPAGGVTLSFHLFEAGATLGPQAVEPTRLPIDVRIERWPRTGNDTRLGAEFLLQSSGAMSVQEEGWHAAHALAEHDLRWSPEYTRNGSVAVANVAALERPGSMGFGTDSAQTTLLAGYEAGDIVHSFSFGTEPQAQAPADLVQVVQALMGDPRLYAVGVIVSALVVGLTSARKMRRRQ